MEEAEERKLQEQAEAARAALVAAAQKQAEEAAAVAAAEAQREAQEREAEERRSVRAQTSADLPEEPAQAADVTTVVVRMPEGEHPARSVKVKISVPFMLRKREHRPPCVRAVGHAT